MTVYVGKEKFEHIICVSVGHKRVVLEGVDRRIEIEDPGFITATEEPPMS